MKVVCSNYLLIQIFLLTVVMAMHVMVFKSEISSIFDLEKFRITKFIKYVKGIPSLLNDIMELIKDYNITVYNNIIDKLKNDILNPKKLLSDVFVFQDNADESVLIFVKNNWLVILILIIAGFFVILPALSIVLASSLLAIPGLIIVCLTLYICVICLGIFYYTFVRDNTSEIIICAEGLDASGNIIDQKTMSNKDKLKMRFCKYWLESVEPVTLIFPSLANMTNIKIVKVIKDATGKAIRVILPGNVNYDVKPLDTLIKNKSTIYLDPKYFDLLKNNMALFKNPKDASGNVVEIYGSSKARKKMEKTFLYDYKTNMMSYFGINNIKVYFFYTFAVLFLLSTNDSIRNLMHFRSGPSDLHIVVDSDNDNFTKFLVLIVKLGLGVTPFRALWNNLSHLDLINDKIFGGQALLLLFEILIYSVTGLLIISQTLLTGNYIEYITCLGPASLRTWLVIIWFLACTIKILLGDILLCEIDGTNDSKNFCSKTIWTSLQRRQECDKLSKSIETEEFTNISNKKSINKLLDYSSIREGFTDAGRDGTLPPVINERPRIHVDLGIGENKKIIKQMRKYNCAQKLDASGNFIDKKNKPISTKEQFKLFWKNFTNDMNEIYMKKPSKTTLLRFIKSIDWGIFMSIPLDIVIHVCFPLYHTLAMSEVSFIPTIEGDGIPLVKKLITWSKRGFVGVLFLLVSVLTTVEAIDTDDDDDDDDEDSIGIIIMFLLPYLLLGICEILWFLINRPRK